MTRNLVKTVMVRFKETLWRVLEFTCGGKGTLVPTTNSNKYEILCCRLEGLLPLLRNEYHNAMCCFDQSPTVFSFTGNVNG